MLSYHVQGRQNKKDQEELLIGMLKIVTSKMSCAQVKERAVKDSALPETNMREEAMDLKSSVFYGLRRTHFNWLKQF